jgi:hypothetical protein
LVCTTQDFHRADQSGGPLKLLKREQAQGVAHDHGQSATAIETAQIRHQPTNRHGERSNAEIGFGLAAARRKPEQIGVSCQRLGAVHVRRVGQGGNREKYEGELERTPGAVLRYIHIRQVQFLAAPLPQRIDAVDPLRRHGVIGKPERRQRFVVARQHVDALAQAAMHLRTPIHGSRGGLVVALDIRPDAQSLLLDPVGVVISQNGESRDEVLAVHFRQANHVQIAVCDHLLERGPIRLAQPRRLGDRHFVFRQHHCSDFDGVFRVVVRRDRVDRDAMTDGELHLLPIEHFQRFAFLVGAVRLQHGTTLENGLPLRGADHDFGLENPGCILVLSGADLAVHQEERHQSVAGGQRLTDGPTYRDFRGMGIDSRWRDLSSVQANSGCPACLLALPAAERLTRFRVLLRTLRSHVAAPVGRHIQFLHRARNTERQSE